MLFRGLVSRFAGQSYGYEAVNTTGHIVSGVFLCVGTAFSIEFHLAFHLAFCVQYSGIGYYFAEFAIITKCRKSLVSIGILRKPRV